MSFTGSTLESHIVDTLQVTSAIKHVDRQRCICSVEVMCRFIAYCISFVTRQKVQTQTFIETGTRVDWNVLLAGDAGSTAHWCKVGVTEGWIKQQLFATLIPWFPHNLFLPVSTFHKTVAAQNDKAAKILLLICCFIPALLSLQMSWTHPLSLSTPNVSCFFTISHSACELMRKQ